MGTHVELVARPPLRTAVALGSLQRLGAMMRGVVSAPLRDRRFWLIQGLVFSVAGLHNALERISSMPRTDMLCFVPTALFFMPVVVAAVNFGMRGSVATAIWCTVLTLPNTLFWHSGFERYGEIAQLSFVGFAAVFLGTRVDQERRAYARVAAVSRALELSQTRYRELFESAREGMLVLDASGLIVECNAAARALAPARRELNRRHVGEVFPSEAVRHLMEQLSHPDKAPHAIALGGSGMNETWVEPLCTPLDGDAPTTQVVLRNVTQQRRRQIGLETYTARMHEAQEDERRRIAQEIHDETVQSLVLLCRELDELEDRSRGTSPELIGSLGQAREHAEEIVEMLRVLIRGIRPPLLDDLGPAPAVQRLLTDLAAHSSIRTNVVVTGAPRRAPHGVELAMLRIAQEAVHNSERHGQPSYVDVHIKYEHERVELEVRDDGRGFVLPADPSDFAKPGKWGIIGMHERAREVGGELQVSSTPGAGTTVSAAFGV
jgi:signal transduction histidine kinase